MVTNGQSTRRTNSCTIVSTHAWKIEYLAVTPLTVIGVTSALRRLAWWNMYPSCRRPRRWRMVSAFSTASRSSKLPAPAEVSIHSCTVQAGVSQL